MRAARWLPVLVALAVAACGGSNEDPAGAGGAAGKGAGGDTGGTGGTTGGTGGTGGTTGGTGGTDTTSGAGGSSGSTANIFTFGDAHEGQYHLGPVDFAETEWHNACAPAGGYRSALRESAGLGGELIAGVSNEYNQGGGVCDACILIETALNHRIVARVVTYGVEQEPGDIDVSPSVFEAINEGEFPRTMTWRFAACPDVGPLLYEFQTEANVFWTSLWVRNPAVPIEKVEVQSANHASFFELRRELDGTLNDDGGFGEGAFTLRVTGIDGRTASETFAGFTPGELVTGTDQL